MGWWSETIMGGDAPLDVEYDVLRLAKLVNDDGSDADSADDDYFRWEEHPARVKVALEAVPLARWEELFAVWGADGDGGVAHQVVALMHMASGAKLPDTIAQAAIVACETEDTSGWGEPQARQARLDEFAAAVRGYDGTPTVMPQEGLMDKLAEHLGAARPKLH